jgi:hypothetical protein
MRDDAGEAHTFLHSSRSWGTCQEGGIEPFGHQPLPRRQHRESPSGQSGWRAFGKSQVMDEARSKLHPAGPIVDRSNNAGWIPRAIRRQEEQ